MDPKAEFDRKDQHKIRCGWCNKTSKARADNYIECFKEHRKSAKCRQSTSNQQSILSYFSGTTSASGKTTAIVPSTPAHLCLGLGYVDDSRILAYLSRPVMLYRGAHHWSILKYTILTDHRQKKGQTKLLKLVLLHCIKAHEHVKAIWVNNHYLSVVFSSKCLGQSICLPGSDVIKPCQPCKMVLQYQVFCNTLRHPKPKKGKVKFTPKENRNEIVGEAYLRHTDVQELMEMVCSL